MNWLVHGAYEAALMLWETFWALVLGYAISAVLRVLVRKETMTRQFGRADWRSIGWATVLGAVSSSCSYAASAAAKTAFRKGAALPVALAFMFASTNLVVELSAILWVLMGPRFVLAEAVGALVLIGAMWAIVRATLPAGLEDEARRHGESDEEGTMEGQAAAAVWSRIGAAFRMDLGMVWKEILGGFLFAGYLMTFIPRDWWKALFLSGGPGPVRLVENCIVGPLIAVASFVCSCGNIPLASWMWSNGISFGGVASFIYADLIILPIILIYRKYYGGRAAAYITAVLFASMVVAGIVVDVLFHVLGLIPSGPRPPSPMQTAHFGWNATTWLDLGAAIVAAVLFALRAPDSAPACCGHGR